MQRCPSCETVLEDDADACGACGAPLETTTCRNCGTEYQGTDACPVCGTIGAEVRCAEHPDRDAVGRCVVCGTAVCSTCRSGDRRAIRCPDHRSVPVIEGWAQVYSTGSEFEARLVTENLHAEGIEAQTFSQRDHMFSVELGDLSLVRVLVPAWQYELARTTIRDHMDTEGEVAFACPRCGDAYEPGAAGCARCGAALA